jgi:glutaredoxin-related protein
MRPTAITKDHLIEMYNQATRKNGLNDLMGTQDAKTPTNIKMTDLLTLFGPNVGCTHHVWDQIKTKNGHANFKNVLVGRVHVGFSCHGVKAIPKHEMKTIYNNVQDLLDTIRDQVYKIPNWETTPDYAASLTRYKALFAQTRST